MKKMKQQTSRQEREEAIARARAWADKRRAQRIKRTETENDSKNDVFHDACDVVGVVVDAVNGCNVDTAKNNEIPNQMLKEEEEILLKTQLKIEMIKNEMLNNS